MEQEAQRSGWRQREVQVYVREWVNTEGWEGEKDQEGQEKEQKGRKGVEEG